MTDEEIAISDSAELGDVDEFASGDDVPPTSANGLSQWRLAESTTGIILASAAIVVLAGAGAAIIGILQSPTAVGGTQGQVTGTVLEAATTWSGVGGAVLLFLALALLWHLATSAITTVHEIEEINADEDPGAEERLRDALFHLGRAQTLTSITTILLCLNIIATGAAFAGVVIEGGSPSFDLRWEQYIMGAGVCVAGFLLLLGGLNVVRYLNLRFASLDIITTSDLLEDLDASPDESIEANPTEVDQVTS